MDKVNTQSLKNNTASDETTSSDTESMLGSSPQSATSAQSFFNSSERSQTPSQPQIPFNPNSAFLLLLSGIWQELQKHNNIELLKLKLEADKTQAEIENAEQEKLEDKKRFESVGHMFS